jgi:PTH1 family peptidyl-tRNA hydrolase
VKLIVGLGNPGREYRETRHNVGFLVVDELARRAGLTWGSGPSQIAGTLVAKRYGAEPLMLAKPLTFMNRSGAAAAGLSRYYDVPAEAMLVVVDEVALPLGKLRLRADGSAGGHNGLRSVIEGLGTTAFPRLRLGVGRGDGRRDLADHVLSTFETGERADLELLIARAADAVELFAAEGVVKAMNVYNPDGGAESPS